MTQRLKALWQSMLGYGMANDLTTETDIKKMKAELATIVPGVMRTRKVGPIVGERKLEAILDDMLNLDEGDGSGADHEVADGLLCETILVLATSPKDLGDHDYKCALDIIKGYWTVPKWFA